MAALLSDVRYALRVMAGRPFFTAMAALSLALGIGANTAIYSFMDSILLRALPAPNPDSLVVLNWHSREHPALVHNFSGSAHMDPKTGFTSGNFPYAAFKLFAADSPVFAHVFAFANAGRMNVQVRGQADLAVAQYVSGSYFAGLGVPPAAGRLLDEADDRPGATESVVISYGYAQRRFGDPARAVGQAIRINDNPFTIAGVAAPGFFGVNPANQQDVYLPMHASLIFDRVYPGDPNEKYFSANSYWVEMMARLRPGVTIGRAQAVLGPVFQRLVDSTAHDAPERSDEPALLLQEGAGGLDFLRRQYSRPLYVLMTLAGLILLIACANIANMLLARAAGRRKEMAVRLSLGAGRARIVRQLLTESVLLASIGGLLGLAFAAWGIRALTLLLANGRENFTLHASLNWHVLVVTAALSIATGAIFGLAPALQSTSVDLVSALKQARLGGEKRRLRPWLRVSLGQALVVAQIAVSLLILVAAGLFVRTLLNLNSIQVGFNQENLLLVTLNARQAGYQGDSLMRFYTDLQASLERLPGVRAVSFSHYALVSGSRSGANVLLPGGSPDGRNSATINIGPSFFTTMQIPVLLGREIDSRDAAGPRRVAVVNETFVRTFFGGVNPLGRHFGLRKREQDFEIIGVSKDTRLDSLKRDIPPMAYLPYAQNPNQSLGQMVYEIRAAGDPLGLASEVRRAVRQADAKIPISNLVTQKTQIDQTIVQERTFATLCACFAALALLIACVGLYGTMAYAVARRTNEIGIRMALGAERRRVIWMVLREVLTMAGAGLAIGIPVAIAVSKVIGTFLFGLQPNDPVTMIEAVVALVGAAIAAGYGPAYRVSRLDPWNALRDE
jgi:predicted permease